MTHPHTGIVPIPCSHRVTQVWSADTTNLNLPHEPGNGHPQPSPTNLSSQPPHRTTPHHTNHPLPPHPLPPARYTRGGRSRGNFRRRCARGAVPCPFPVADF